MTMATVNSDQSILDELKLIEQEKADEGILAELNADQEINDEAILAELNQEQTFREDEPTIRVKSVLGGYDTHSASPNKIKEIAARTGGASTEEDVRSMLRDKDPDTLMVEADLSNLVRRDKNLANFAGANKKNLDFVKSNYVKAHQLSGKAKNLASGKSLDNWDKIARQNSDSMTAAYNALAFFYGSRSLEEFVATENVLRKNRQKHALSGEAITKVQEFWDNPDKGFTDYLKMLVDDPNTAVAQIQEGLGTIVTSGASIIGSVAGGVTGGAVAGPVGAAKGAILGGGTLNGIAEFGGYVSGALEEYKGPDGQIDINKVKADKNFIPRLRFEASVKGISTAIAEVIIGKIAGKVLNVPLKYVKPVPLKEIVSVRTAAKASAVATAKVAVKAGEEFAEEAGGSIVTETGMDAYKGRLTPKKFRENITQGVREGVSGAVLGASTSVVGGVYDSSKLGVKSLLSSKGKAQEAYAESQKADKAKTFTKEVYETQNEAEASGMDEDAVEEFLSHAMNRDATPVEPSSVEVADVTSGGVPSIQLDFLEVEAVLGEEKTQEFIQSLPFEIQEKAIASINDGGVTEIPANVFIARTMKYPSIVPLGVHPDAQMHAHDAEELQNKIEKQIEEELIPPVEAARTPKDEQVLPVEMKPLKDVSIKVTGPNTIELNMGGNIQTLNLYAEESAQEYAEVSDTLIRGLLGKLPNTLAEMPEFIPNLTAVATRVILKRAKVLGVSAKDLAAGLRIAYIESGAYMGLSRQSVAKLPPHVSQQLYNVGARGEQLTVFHEMAHYVLNGFAEDKVYLNSLPSLTPEQADYLEVIKAAEKFLEVQDITKAVEFPSTPVEVVHPNPEYNDSRKMRNGKVVKNQSGDTLTIRTIVHEKFATSMEKFILKGELPKNATPEFVKLFIYTANTAKDVTHLLTPEKSFVAVEYTNAVSPNDDVAKVFGGIYNITEDFLTRVVPLFNFPSLPIQLLGAKGPDIIKRVSSVKYNLIAQEFIKFYENQTKVRRALEETFKNYITDDDIKAIAINSGAPTYNKLLDLIDLGLLGKIRTSDLKQNLNGMHSRIAGMVSEARADSRLVDAANMMGMTEQELVAALKSEMDNITGTIGKAAYDRAFELDKTLKTDKELQEMFEQGIARALPSLLKKQMQDISKMYPQEMSKFFSLMSKTSPSLRGDYAKKLRAAGLRKALMTSARQLTFPRLMNAVKRANMAVITAFNSGRLEHALMAKEEEVIASYALEQGIKLKPKVERAIKNIRNFSKARTVSSETNTAPEIINHLKMVIYNVGSGQAPSTFTPMTEAKFEEEVARYSEANPSFTPEWVRKAMEPRVTIVSQTTMDSMPQEDIDHLNFLSKAVFDAVREQGEGTVASVLMLDNLITWGEGFAGRVRAAELEAIQGKIAEDAKSLQGTLENVKREIDFRTKGPFQFHDIHTVFRTMYETDEEYLNSPIYARIESIINNEAKLTSDKAEISKKLHAAFKKSFKSDENFLRTLLGKYVTLENNSPYLKPIKSNQLGFTYANKGELITALLLAGSDSGRERFLLSNGLIDPNSTSGVIGNEIAMFNDFEEMFKEGILTEADLNAVNAVWTIFETLFPKVKEVYREHRGIGVGKIKPSPYTIGGIELKGGYYPVGYKQDSKLETSDQKSKSFTDTFTDIYRLMPSWMTKTRADKVLNNPVDLSLNKISSYIDITLRTYYLERDLDSFATLINTPEVYNLIQQKRKGALEANVKDSLERTVQKGVIDSWILRTRNQTVISNSDASGLQKFIAGNLPVVQYAGGVISGAVNLTAGLAPLLTEIRADRVFATIFGTTVLKTLITDGKLRTDASAKSAFMRSREAEFVKFFIDSDNSIEQVYTDYETFQDKFVRPVGLFLMKRSQMTLELIAWQAAYDHALSQGKGEMEAVSIADFKTRAVIGGYEASASSKGQSGGFYMKLVNMAALHLYVGRRQMFIAYNREGGRVSRNIAAFATAATIAGLGSFLDYQVRKALTASSKLYTPPEEEEREQVLALLSGTLGYGLGPFGRVGDLFSKFDSPNPYAGAYHTVTYGGKAIINELDYLANTGDFAPYPMTPWEKKSLAVGGSLFSGMPFTGPANIMKFLDLFKDKGELYSEEVQNKAMRQPFLESEKYTDQGF